MQARSAIPFFVVVFAFTALGPLLVAQTFNLAADGRQIVALDGLMRFQPGDDPQLSWASPTFDDSSWPLIRGDQGWTTQGYPQLYGLGWYRFKILMPDRTPSLALWLPYINTSFQIYADGRLIGEFGGMPPHPRVVSASNFVFPIPGDIIRPGRTLTLALRVWKTPWESMDTGGLQGAMQFGDASLIRDWQTYQKRETFWENTQQYMTWALWMLGAAGAFMLFFMSPSDREYLWFGIFQLFNVLYGSISIYTLFNPTNDRVLDFFYGGVFLGVNVALATFIRYFLKIGRTRLYWATVVIAICYALVLFLFPLGAMTQLQFLNSQAFCLILLAICDCALIFSGPKDGPVDARVLAIPVGFFLCNLSAFYVGITLQAHGVTWLAPYMRTFFAITSWPFPLGSVYVLSAALPLTVFAILLVRFARTRRDEERFKNELEAARTVQSVLVPAEIPSIPGLSISGVYRPASQVGGDFFQIIPTADGDAIVAIGDVSGKGMPAAMTVSLLVGTLRTLAHYTQRPSEILAAMNQRMLERSAGGFTTCLVLTLAADGTLAVANAGHIAPYLDGRELPVANGLPLGLSADADYTESTFRVAESEQLTLMTDGIAEARAKNGELFGFERAAELSTGSAESIADAAQVFGQEDDITVVTIKRIHLPVSAPIRSVPTAPETLSAPEPI